MCCLHVAHEVDVWTSAEPADIIPGILTHILYCFADVSADTGAARLTDSYADEGIHYPGDSWGEPGNNVGISPLVSAIVCTDTPVLRGSVVVRKHQAGRSHLKLGRWRTDPLIRPQLYLLKLKQRNLKVLLSVGGWTYSQSGHFNFVTDASKRANFVSSAVTLIEDYGFDGMYASIVLADFDFWAHIGTSDIDFEYPSNDDQATGFASLLAELRSAFDQLASRKGDTVPYTLSVRNSSPNFPSNEADNGAQAAVPAGESNYQKLKISNMNAVLDFWNLMVSLKVQCLSAPVG